MSESEYYCHTCQRDNPHPVIGMFCDKDGRFLGHMPTCSSCGRAVGSRVDQGEPSRAPIKPTEESTKPAAYASPAVERKIAQLTTSKPELSGLTPKTLVKQAKARVKELDAVIRECRKLERERDELRRLIAASKNSAAKPTSRHLAKVRPLAS